MICPYCHQQNLNSSSQCHKCLIKIQEPKINDAQKAKIQSQQKNTNDDQKLEQTKLMKTHVKTHVNVAFVGAYKSGKSTLIGHLSYLCGTISQVKIQRAKLQSKAFNKKGQHFSCIINKLSREKERGTMDVSTFNLPTKIREFTLIDLPGNKKYQKNYVRGLSMGDVGVWVVSVPTKQFKESSINLNTHSLKDYPLVLYSNGFRRLIVCINKMEQIQFQQKIFEQIKQKIVNILLKIGYKINKQVFIPISALQGDNIIQKSNKTDWYKKQTLLQALQNVEIRQRKNYDPFRMPIEDVYKICGIGTVVVGKVQSGKIQKGDAIIISPTQIEKQVISIQTNNNQIKTAYSGDYIGIHFKGISRKQINRGDVICGKEHKISNVCSFNAKIAVFFHPTQIMEGYSPIISLQTANIKCKFKKLIFKYKRNSNQIIQEFPKRLRSADLALVQLKPIKPIHAQQYSKSFVFGRFLIRDMNMIIGAGRIQKVHYQKDT